MKISGIYCITNLINGKIYIGKSQNIEQRWKIHYLAKSNSYIHRSIRKYGLKNFTFEIIKETYDLNYWEKFCIQLYHSYIYDYPERGYNMSKGGEGNPGLKYSESSKRKISEHHANVSGKNNPMFGKNIKDFMNENDYKDLLLKRSEFTKMGNNPNSKKVKCIELNKIFNCIKDATKETGMSLHLITKSCNGVEKTRKWKHYKYHFIYC
jgi:group I intron endonuclease